MEITLKQAPRTIVYTRVEVPMVLGIARLSYIGDIVKVMELVETEEAVEFLDIIQITVEFLDIIQTTGETVYIIQITVEMVYIIKITAEPVDLFQIT